MKQEGGISRGEFLKLMGHVGGTILATKLGLKIADVDLNFDESEYYPQPYWLNPRGEKVPTFFNTKNGHEDYLRASIFNSRVLKRSLAEIYERRYFHPNPTPPLLGQEFQEHITLVRHEFNREFGIEPSLSDQLRAASLTMAASAIFTPSDIKKIAEIEFPQSPFETDELQKQVMLRTFPRVFPVTPPKDVKRQDFIYIYSGIDRFFHFSQHLAIVSEFMHLQKDGVQDKDLMPEMIAQVYKLPYPNRENSAAFSNFVGHGWEALEGLSYPPWKVALLGKNKGVQTGPYDRFMTLDFPSNVFGAWVGAATYNPATTRERCDQITEIMCHPKVTEPIKDRWYPEVSLEFALPIAI